MSQDLLYGHHLTHGDKPEDECKKDRGNNRKFDCGRAATANTAAC
jgi:hypothetical protein